MTHAHPLLFEYRMRLPDVRVEVEYVDPAASGGVGGGGWEGAGYPYCAWVRWGKAGSGGQSAASTSRDPWRACYAAVLKHRRWRERIERAENERRRRAAA
jgi:hypothetical protein